MKNKKPFRFERVWTIVLKGGCDIFREYRVLAMPSVSTNRCIFLMQDPKTEGIAFLPRVSRPRDALGFQEEVYLLKARPKNRGHRVSSESIASPRCPRFLVKLI